MQILRIGAALLTVLVAGLALAQQPAARQLSDRERLIGAWHLAHIDVPGTDGKPVDTPQPKGMLIYTRDGHMSVQLMYPEMPHVPDNAYVHDNYEASFGSYEVDEAHHTVTHHVQAANTRAELVGKDLTRVYQFTGGGKLVIQSANPNEHWRVVWQRD